MKEINCPYCDHPQDINHDDGFGYDESVTHEMECEKCEKNFVFTSQISWDFYPEKADCLNGGEHNYQQTHTFPKEYTKMQCTMCADERKPTEEEWIIIKTK
jgi:hypothetical protein